MSISDIPEDSKLIEIFRKEFISLENQPDEYKVQDFLTKSEVYLKINLFIDTLNELISTTISCFKNYPKELLPFFEELLKNSQLNENYIILTSTIIALYTNMEPQLSLPDYHQFVSTALNEISPRIHNNERLVVFDHEIRLQFKNDLIINLLLSTDLTEDLIFTFFPFLFIHNLPITNTKFELLLKKLIQTNFHTILPQTDTSNNELFEFITSKDLNLISKMSKESFSLIETAFSFTKSDKKVEIKGLSKTTILQFIAISSIFIGKFSFKPVLTADLTYLIIEGISYSENNGLNVITASIDEIMTNCFDYWKSDLISTEASIQIFLILFQQLKNDRYLAKKTIILNSIFIISSQSESPQNIAFFNQFEFDILNLCVKYLSELNRVSSKLDLNYFKKQTVFDFIENSEDILKSIYFVDNYCINQPKVEKSDKLIQRLFEIALKSIEEKNDQNILFIGNFFKRNTMNDILLKLCELPIPDDIKHYFLKTEKTSIDEILYYLLNSENIESSDVTELLINKMLECPEIIDIYLTFRIYKYINYEFNIDTFLRVYKDEYEKYNDRFLNCANNVFTLNIGNNVLIRNLNFSIYSLQIPEIGASIITKLFESIKQKENNYQAFFCLKNIACSFPILFYNRHEEIIEIILRPFENFSLLFDSNFLNGDLLEKAKTAYSAFSFFSTTLILPIMFDKLIQWFNEKIFSLSDSQIFGFMLILTSSFNSFYTNYCLLAYDFKIKIIEKIGKLLERKITIKNPIFLHRYIKLIYAFIGKYYKALNSFTEKECVQIEEISKHENPFDHLESKIFLRSTWDFIKLKFDLDRFSPSLSKFIENTEKVRRFWLTSDFALYRIEKPNSSEIRSFIDSYGNNKTDQTNYDIPRFPNFYTIKMVRNIVLKPITIYSYFLYNERTLLVPSYYKEICKTNDELYSLLNDINEHPEDEENYSIDSYDKNKILLHIYCQETLLSNLINQINLPYIKNDDLPCNTLYFIALNEIALLSIFQLIYQNICIDSSILSPSILSRTIKILSNVPEQNAFKENFFDMCGNKLIDIILTTKFRNNSNLMIEMGKFLCKLKEDIKLPNKVIELISLLIISKDDKSISVASNLYSKFEEEEEKLNIINELLIDYFDNESQKEIISPSLIDVIKDFPILFSIRRVELINMISRLIEQYSKDKNVLKIISQIFNEMAPKRENSLSRTQIIEESTIPETIRETSPFFWNLFEKNSKFIYDLLNEDSLYLDEFKFLLNFPELLSFQIRSSYFRKKMIKKINNSSSLRLNIDRNNLLNSSFASLQNKTKDELLQKIRIKFINEEGYDAGGLKREWFTELSKKLFNQNYGLFSCSGRKKSYRPNSLSYINPSHLDYFKFAGKFIARALIESQSIDAHLSSSFCKQILHREPNLNDLEEIDEEIFSSLNYMKNNDVNSLDMVFAVNKDELGFITTIPLKENGENIDVNNDNKMEYIRLRSNYSFYGIIEKQIKAFCEGFDSLISHDEIKIFTANELDLLICGIPVINVDDFIKNTAFEGSYNKDTPVVKMFFNVISSWDNEKLAKLLLFMTGSSSVPTNGFTEFCEITGHSLTISPGGERSQLPTAHTCYNMICLPEYQSEEELNDKLLFAIQNSNTFEFH